MNHDKTSVKTANFNRRNLEQKFMLPCENVLNLILADKIRIPVSRLVVGHYDSAFLTISSSECTMLLITEPRQANLCLRAFRHDKL